MSRELKEGSKGYCSHCGFRIEVMNIPTGKVFSGPFWFLAWVHRNADSSYFRRSCFWVASPKKHTKKKVIA